jgi:hypothetical protein
MLWVQAACIAMYRDSMGKVIQIRDVPDEVHEALTAAALDRDQSLTTYLKEELAALAARPDVVRHNREVIRRVRRGRAASVDRETVLAALREGRGE